MLHMAPILNLLFEVSSYILRKPANNAITLIIILIIKGPKCLKKKR